MQAYIQSPDTRANFERPIPQSLIDDVNGSPSCWEDRAIETKESQGTSSVAKFGSVLVTECTESNGDLEQIKGETLDQSIALGSGEQEDADVANPLALKPYFHLLFVHEKVSQFATYALPAPVDAQFFEQLIPPKENSIRTDSSIEQHSEAKASPVQEMDTIYATAAPIPVRMNTEDSSVDVYVSPSSESAESNTETEIAGQTAKFHVQSPDRDTSLVPRLSRRSRPMSPNGDHFEHNNGLLEPMLPTNPWDDRHRFARMRQDKSSGEQNSHSKSDKSSRRQKNVPSTPILKTTEYRYPSSTTVESLTSPSGSDLRSPIVVRTNEGDIMVPWNIAQSWKVCN